MKKAKVDYGNNYIYFKHAGDDYKIHANEITEEASLESLVNDYKNGCSMFVALLRNENGCSNERVNRNAEFSAVLSEYANVFPEDLSKILSPKRANEDFEIELKEEAKPVKKYLYRMSHTELAYIKNKLNT